MFCRLCRFARIALVLTAQCALWDRAPVRAAEPSSVAAGLPDGEAVYRRLCLSCHGPMGQGSKYHNTPLVGDRSVLELVQVIEKTMPDDQPGSCVGADAQAVARYIHETFYSPTAQARNAPPRIELSRLTVAQYEQTLADLIDSFANTQRLKPPTGPERGLRAEYFKSPRFGTKERVLERVDPEVSFEFGEQAPLEEMPAEEFSIRWQGSLLAPETGDYEFSVRSEHVARLYLNDLQQPLVDASIKSGKEIEYRATIRLIRGRHYPLKLEYSKTKLGVRDPKKNPPRPAASSIALRWKPPHRTSEVIPQPYLYPQLAPRVFVVQTPFPPDDRSIGYERGASISKAWDQATTDAAIEVATYVSANLVQLSGVANSAADRAEKLQDFCRRLATRAFRRPLEPDQLALYVERPFHEAPDADSAVKRVVLLVLKSPRFLYREVDGPRDDPYHAAARLSYTLWDTLPDQPLLDAAAAGQLQTAEQLTAQAERMVDHPRTHAKVREFFLQWLKLDPAPDLAKSSQQYPGFGPQVSADLRTSLELFLEGVIWSPSSDFRQLLLAEQVPLNGRLAQFYGAPLAADAPFQPVSLHQDQNAGVLTHPYLLASLAYTDASSPIHRGVLISRSMLGRVLRPPPEAVAPLAPDLHPSLTTRQRVVLQTKADACYACHGMINPLGFTLENFDAVGRFREREQGQPIDASGQYQTRSGQTVQFHNARDLAQFLIDSDEAQSALVSQLFHHLVKQPIRAYGPGQTARLQQSFRGHQFSLRHLISQIAVAAAQPPPSSAR